MILFEDALKEHSISMGVHWVGGWGGGGEGVKMVYVELLLVPVNDYYFLAVKRMFTRESVYQDGHYPARAARAGYARAG